MTSDIAPNKKANTDGASAKRCLRVATTFGGPAMVSVLFVLLAVISWRDCGQKNMTGGRHKEWNFAFFSSDSNDGAGVVDWIRKNYQPAVTICHEPLRDSEFGLEFLKRIPPL